MYNSPSFPSRGICFLWSLGWWSHPWSGSFDGSTRPLWSMVVGHNERHDTGWIWLMGKKWSNMPLPFLVFSVATPKLTEMIRKFRGATQLDPGISVHIGPCSPHVVRWWAARSMPWVRGKTISGTPWRFRWPLPPSSGPWPSWETSQASLGEWCLIAMGPSPRCAWAPAARLWKIPKSWSFKPLGSRVDHHGMVLGCLSIGYCLIGVALVSGLGKELKVLLASLGSLLAGYSSVSLLDNITCMACSISFPQNRAAAVGYLKAVLATAGGLWALLWVQVRLVFDTQSGPTGPTITYWDCAT